MHLLPDRLNPRTVRQPPDDNARVPFTRKAFYDLAAETRDIALELARHDQHRVNLDRCYAFNAWLPTVKQYDLLAPRLDDLTPARPVTRRQVIIIGIVVGIFLLLLVPEKVGLVSNRVILWAYTLSLIFFFFVPERYYGSTIEHLEGKTLRVVVELEELLMTNQFGFSEAAFFQVKENLAEASRELRQQLDLAHRKWR